MRDDTCPSSFLLSPRESFYASQEARTRITRAFRGPGTAVAISPQAPTKPAEAPVETPSRPADRPDPDTSDPDADLDDELERIIREIPDPTPQPGGE